MRIQTLIVLAAGAVLATACTSITPGATVAPPSVPPIDLPSVPPIDLPTVAPGGNTSGACALVSESEMTSMMGEPMTVSASEGTICTWTSTSILPTVVLRYDSGETIQAGKLITSNGRDLTIAGNPAYYGEFAGSLLYIEKGGRPLVVQAVWDLEGDAGVQRISQIGELAAGRF
ncbi:hypothetical protein BH24CHL5_BH24CHL5_10140 [soil metagenome]